MLRKLFCFAAAFSFASATALASAGQVAKADPHETIRALIQQQNSEVAIFPQFQERFEQLLRADDVPGGVYAIVHRDRIVEVRPFGVRNAGSNEPIDANTVFRIASVSKTFAGSLTSLLADQGLVDLNARVLDYVPDLSFKNPEFNASLRVEHLVAQTTGVIPNAYDNLIEANLEKQQILPHFQRINPMCTPGACYGYQNVLFSLIEDVVEQRTGKAYTQLVEETLFTPLNMQHASFGLDAYLASNNRAAPHIRGRNGWFTREVGPHYYRYAAAAGVNASATDLAQWLIAQMGYAPDVLPTTAILNSREKRVRTTRDLRRRSWRPFLNDAHYGLGWRVYEFMNHELVYHGGWVQGFRAEIAYSPDYEIGLVVLMNAESAVMNEITPIFWSHVIPLMQEEQWVPYLYANSIRSLEPKAVDSLEHATAGQQSREPLPFGEPQLIPVGVLTP